VKIVDLNVLLYAVNENAAHHAAAHRWWEKAINGEEPVGLPWIVLLGFLRLSVNSAVFPHPLDPETALRKVDSWLALEVTRPLAEKENHWEVLRPLLAASGMAGNLTTDAYLAALAISHDAVLVSFDNDFSRFQGLRWENPGS
jgi:toxin-antitoxin system PIN domain toxin